MTEPIGWVYDDGGRAAAGFKGDAGDCVVRALAIATFTPYREVYDALSERISVWSLSSRSRAAKRWRERAKTPRNGTPNEVWKPYLLDLGWVWTPTMHIGSGTTVHLRADELPGGVVVARVSGHVCTVIDGVVHDTHDPSRDGTRAVYGYLTREGSNR